MISTIPNPALDKLIEHIAPELVFGQVRVRKIVEGFEIRHEEDLAEPVLREVVSLGELRDLAQFTAAHQFRPLKSAPSLRRGWRFRAQNAQHLGDALHCLYPGAVADWFATRTMNPPVTHYRTFTSRQTGMYRITTMLSDREAGKVARAGCHRQFCLKQRLWTVEGFAGDTAESKSLIPCLEPCAVFLEFARTAVRLEQREKSEVALTPAETIALARALEETLMSSTASDGIREADFAAPENRRRVRLLLENLMSSAEMKGKDEPS